MCGDWVGGTKWNGQKLKERLRCEAHITMGGRNARSLSKEKGDAAMCLRLAPNPWALATMQHPRGGKIMTLEAPQATQSAVLFPFPD
jgi:hypothetical protein